MDTPKVYKPSNITKTSFTANWQSVTGATKYYLDVATDAAFTSFVAGYQNKEVAVNYDAVTGLTDTTDYFYRVKAANADDSDVSGYSFSMEVVTGFFVGGMSIEFGNLVADLFNVQGISIEVSTDFNFTVFIRDKDGLPINSVKCLLIAPDWIDKGSWNPNTDPDPSAPAEGDYYTISASGTNDITGEDEEFTIVDMLVYLNSAWQIKKRACVNTDSNGIANMNVFYNDTNLLLCTKSGLQKESQLLNYVAGFHSYDLIMYKSISSITTSKGMAVSHKPDDRTNKNYN